MITYQITQHNLRRGLLVLVSYGLHLLIIDETGQFLGRIRPAQWTIRAHNDIVLLAQRNQFLLVKPRMTFDLWKMGILAGCV